MTQLQSILAVRLVVRLQPPKHQWYLLYRGTTSSGYVEIDVVKTVNLQVVQLAR